MTVESEGQEERSSVLAQRETRVVRALRFAVLALLLITTTLVGVGVYFYTRNEEHDNFETQFDDSAFKVVEAFSQIVEGTLGAIDTMSASITSCARQENRTFPFVTVPDFEVRGANLRVQAGAAVVHWMPLVTDETRARWEEYALENRFQIDEAFERDREYRHKQDEEFGLFDDRSLLRSENPRLAQEEETREETIVDHGYHPRIWSTGAVVPRGDEPEGSGPFLPLWQRRYGATIFATISLFFRPLLTLCCLLYTLAQSMLQNRLSSTRILPERDLLRAYSMFC